MVLKLSQCVAWLANLHWRSPLTQLSTRLQLPVLLHILYYLVYTYLPLSCTVVFSLSWPPFFQKLLSCSCCFFYFQRWNSLNLLNVVDDTYIYIVSSKVIGDVFINILFQWRSCWIYSCQVSRNWRFAIKGMFLKNALRFSTFYVVSIRKPMYFFSFHATLPFP